MFKFTAFVLALSLASCAGQNSVEYTCVSGTAALKTVIALNAKLTPANRAIVAKASNTLNPVCSADTLPTVSAASAAALKAAADQLTAASVQVTQ